MLSPLLLALSLTTTAGPAAALSTGPAAGLSIGPAGGLPAAPAAAAVPPDSLHLRVVDVGAGLCTVTRAPDDRYMIYDAGHWQRDRCVRAARELIPDDRVDLMVLSHSDADHLGDADEILSEFRVRRVVHTGDERGTVTYQETMDSLAAAVRHEGTSVRNLASHPLEPGERMSLGEATVTLVAGWHEWDRSSLSAAERHNAISIVVRIDYGGGSILYSGDTVGRRIGDPADACKDAEAVMVENHRNGRAPLASDVLIAPHHGADNGSAGCFVDAVDPRWVVFPAGHDHGHPRRGAAERYQDEGLASDRLLRTDRGDDESDEPREWDEGSITGCRDRPGDDDVDVVIRDDGTVRVEYVDEGEGC